MTDFILYIGSASDEGGIYRYRFTGDLTGFSAELLDVTPCPHCSYLRRSGNEMMVLARNVFPETDHSGLQTYRIGCEGELTEPSPMMDTRGRSGCHMTKACGQYYAVNYLTGNVVRLPDGRTVQHEGKGLVPDRQEGPHTHCVQTCPNGRELVVTDLGRDTVTLYDPDLNLLDEIHLPAGSGPRHLAFAPGRRLLYCIGELDSIVYVLQWSRGRLKLIGSTPAWDMALPEADGGAIRCAGRRVYVANRRHSRIAILKRRGKSLTFLREISCEGTNPRDFAIHGRFAFSCNCDSDSVTVFSFKHGNLTYLGDIRVPVPFSAEFKNP